tara:strand:+ start:63 stop:719 length:657 start_codon:yes stop_codon:yes gene_type:complete
MPEKVTREEKIIELAILKAREVKALRDGEKIEPYDMEKVKRPKAEKADKIKNQTQKKEGYGLAGEVIGKGLKKAAISRSEKDRLWWSKRWDEVNKNDAVIRRLKKDPEMTPEKEETLKLMIERTDEMYKTLTLLKSKKYKSSSDDNEKKAEDPRDVSFSPEEQESADVRFKEIKDALDHYRKLTGSNPSINDLGKIESAQKKAMEMLNEMTEHYGRGF